MNTIPKRIITAWYGRGEKSDLFKRCIDSWHRMHPDWAFFEANEDTLQWDVPYMQNVLGRREWVKATELARLVALETGGGIYLDCDMEVIKPLDPLLELPDGKDFFIGQAPTDYLNGAIMGATADSETAAELVTRFPRDSLGLEPALVYGPEYLNAEVKKCTKVVVHPQKVFYPYLWTEQDPGTYPEETLVVHRWAGSWLK